MTDVDARVGDRVVRLSSLDRVLWPGSGTTKAELVEHLVATAEPLLAHVRDRPLTLHRFPEGVEGKHFFQTRTPPHADWLRTVTLSYPRTGKTFEAPVVDDVAGLVWAVNLTTIEVHPFLGTVDALDAPTALVLDLDPGQPAGMVQACAVGLLLRAELDARGLRSYPKTSGGKGLHVHVPVRGATYDDTKPLARRLATDLARAHPDLVVERMTRTLRVGKVLVDWSQNDPGKSTVAPWSVRGHALPTVAVPVAWEEVEQVVASGDPRPLRFLLQDAAQRPDLFGPLLDDPQVL